MAMKRTTVKLKLGRNSDIDALLCTFDDLSCTKEHLALVILPDQLKSSPLVRVHSECLTGDVFFSSRCDCGNQLNEAIEFMAEEGGVILYLRQEGRGIGLYPKIDAYELQDKGHDTFAANCILGFPEDSRDFQVAAEMLEVLGIKDIELLTNNPEKVAALTSHGIHINQVRNTNYFETDDNQNYLIDKVRFKSHALTKIGTKS